eukprot:jgi/Tetstr1/446764/TSEL_034251.t1
MAAAATRQHRTARRRVADCAEQRADAPPRRWLLLCPAVASRLDSALGDPAPTLLRTPADVLRLQVVVMSRASATSPAGERGMGHSMRRWPPHRTRSAGWRLTSGALVEVRRAGAGGGVRLARLIALGESEGGRPGALHLPPLMAFNLGLRPCVAPLLAPRGEVGVGLEKVEVAAAAGAPSSAGESTHAVPQPLGRPLRVRVATRVTAARVRLPRAQPELASAEDAGTTLVAALQAHFRAVPRSLAPGDVFAVEVRAGDGRRELLRTLYPAPNHAWGGPTQEEHNDVHFFIVDSMEPDSCALVDPDRTALSLGGSGTSGLPVGTQGYCEAAAGAHAGGASAGAGGAGSGVAVLVQELCNPQAL